MLGVQQTCCSDLPCPSLAIQRVALGLSGSVLNLRQHILLLAQLLCVVYNQILRSMWLTNPFSAHSDPGPWNQVQGSTCCFWDVHTFGVVLVAQRVEVQVAHAQWAQMSKGMV